MTSKKTEQPEPRHEDIVELEDARARLKRIRDATLTDVDKRILTDSERDDSPK